MAQRHVIFCGLILMVISIGACYTPIRPAYKKKNPLPFVWLPFANARIKQVYYHSLVESHRFQSDCGYFCPDVDVWRYQYLDNNSKKIIASDQPISTLKKFWKAPDEARIIAISLFGKEFYYHALLQYIESFKNIKTVNNITDPIWGYETFTVRVYVPKRNPKNFLLGDIKGGFSDAQIHHLLELGCEVVYVDNRLSEAKKDATFWRFSVLKNPMPENERIRYLLRDADHILTAAEMYAVADWIKSDLKYHRMHLVPICFGPLTASFWGGSHTGVGDFSDFYDMVKNYPYRFQYGDDELFSRDLLWPRLKSIGSILTHYFARSSLVTAFAAPYKNSCEEPTQIYCQQMNQQSTCEDRLIPNEKNFSGVVDALGLRVSLEELLKTQPEIFNLELKREDRKFIYEAFKGKKF